MVSEEVDASQIQLSPKTKQGTTMVDDEAK